MHSCLCDLQHSGVHGSTSQSEESTGSGHGGASGGNGGRGRGSSGVGGGGGGGGVGAGSGGEIGTGLGSGGSSCSCSCVGGEGGDGLCVLALGLGLAHILRLRLSLGLSLDSGRSNACLGLRSRSLSNGSRPGLIVLVAARSTGTATSLLCGSSTKSLGVDEERRVSLGALVGGTSWDGRLGGSSAAAAVEEVAQLARVGDVPDARRVHAIGVADDRVVGGAALEIRPGQDRSGGEEGHGEELGDHINECCRKIKVFYKVLTSDCNYFLKKNDCSASSIALGLS